MSASLALASAQSLADEAARAERARNVTIIRELAQGKAMQAAAAKIILHAEVRTLTMEELFARGARYQELIGAAEALAEAANALEEGGGA